MLTAPAIHTPRAGRRTLRRLAPTAVVVALFGAGVLGAYRYVENFWVYRGFAPPKDASYVRQHGATQRFYVASRALGGRRQAVDVYLPPGYVSHAAKRYPVMYLLHGFPGRPDAFLATVRMGVVEDDLVATHRARPMILVMPFGSTGSFTDKEWANGTGNDNDWATFVARDVVDAIDARYRTIPTGSARVLAGLSEGGYGAINIGLQHPGEFRTLESWSGYMRADDIGSIFDHERTMLAANSPLKTLPSVAARLRRDGTYIWFYTGSKDSLQPQNAAFARELTRERIPHTFFVVRGGHNWALWRGNAARAYLSASRRIHVS